MTYLAHAHYDRGEHLARFAEATRYETQLISLAESTRHIAHCHLGLGQLYRRAGKREQSYAHLTVASMMYREMDLRLWLEQAESEMQSSTA
jgi:uncharacterized protein YceH (UPF0502 family)